MRFIACIDGALGGISATLCAAATASSFGTAMFVKTESASQKSKIGTEKRRIVRGSEKRHDV
ncbi:hypothetical protein ATCCBAA256_31770 [Mycobacterium montefiorense]|nr:hypothetical protein ATCCBAA256_31770 [Mycobacterium montefiorense]